MPAPTATISAGVRVEGTIHAGEDLSVLGEVAGAIESTRDVLVEAGGVVLASIRARRVVVRGIVVGPIAATEVIHVAASGQVAGDLRTAQLRLVPGGRVDGQVETGVEVVPARSRAPRRHATSTVERAGVRDEHGPRRSTSTWGDDDATSRHEGGSAVPPVAAPARPAEGGREEPLAAAPAATGATSNDEPRPDEPEPEFEPTEASPAADAEEVETADFVESAGEASSSDAGEVVETEASGGPPESRESPAGSGSPEPDEVARG